MGWGCHPMSAPWPCINWYRVARVGVVVVNLPAVHSPCWCGLFVSSSQVKSMCLSGYPVVAFNFLRDHHSLERRASTSSTQVAAAGSTTHDGTLPVTAAILVELFVSMHKSMGLAPVDALSTFLHSCVSILVKLRL
jgi:hypothetical protein